MTLTVIYHAGCFAFMHLDDADAREKLAKEYDEGPAWHQSPTTRR